MDKPPPGPQTSGGSYVGFVSDSRPEADFSLVVETIDEKGSSCSYGNTQWGPVPHVSNEVEFCLSETVCKHHEQLSVRLTHVEPEAQSRVLFELQDPIPLPRDAACCFKMTLLPNAIYSLSTRSDTKKCQLPVGSKEVTPPEGAARGCGPFPVSLSLEPFPFPYATQFSKHRFSDFPEFLSDVQGVFRIRNSSLVQLMDQSQTRQHFFSQENNEIPLSLLGSKLWKNYAVRTVARLDDSGDFNSSLSVSARVGHGYAFGPVGGYSLRFFPKTGRWLVSVNNISDPYGFVLASGNEQARDEEWTSLGIEVQDATVIASLDNGIVVSIVDTQYTDGLAGLGSGWNVAVFERFSVSPASSHVLSV